METETIPEIIGDQTEPSVNISWDIPDIVAYKAGQDVVADVKVANDTATTQLLAVVASLYDQAGNLLSEDILTINVDEQELKVFYLEPNHSIQFALTVNIGETDKIYALNLHTATLENDRALLAEEPVGTVATLFSSASMDISSIISAMMPVIALSMLMPMLKSGR